MKKLKLITAFLSLCCLVSCEETENQEQRAETKKVAVKTITIKKENIKDVKSFFGTLRFSKSTDFVAQQPGIVTKLNVVPGQRVKQGEVVAVFPPLNHQLQVEQAIIQQNKTQQDYNRQKELFKAGAVSKLSVEDFKAQLDIEKRTTEQLKRTNTITAPFTGVITQVHANIGQELGMDMPIFSMAQTGLMEVTFYVTSSDISEIKPNAPVFFIKNGKRVDGNITKKSIQMDNRRKAYMVTASFYSGEIPFVGGTIDVFVETGEAVETIWIPVDALRRHVEGYYAYVLNENKAIKKNITIGKRNEENAQVTSGLQPDDQLIVAGIDKLKENTLVIASQQN